MASGLPATRAKPLAWVTEPRGLALWAAMAGFVLDSYDVLLYVFVVQALRAEFGWSAATAGIVSSATLITSAIGGIAAGILSDRIGRRRTLVLTILVYSIGSGGSATAAGLVSLLLWRSVVGLGLGGEWSAGAVLVSESWPAKHRAKAIALMQSGWALGYMLAAAVTALVLPRFGWRVLFLTGLAPALLTIWIQRKVAEPQLWVRESKASPFLDIFRRPLAKRTWLGTALATSTLFAYWGLNTWLPGFLSAPRTQGGGGLNILETSAWIFIMQFGTFLGYATFGWIADWIGRRPAFLIFVLIAAVLTPVYGLTPVWAGASAEFWLLVLGPFVGFFGTGFFSVFGAMLSELYPTSIRGSAQGFIYNSGRAASALAPFAVGAIADRRGFGAGLALNSAFFLIAAVLIFGLPETRNTELS
ncbi:MAG TPA: MFS transporter [Bryobacteraceae bacterium]|nr:MFS transporter [Bryobacteraceae bacterium]